MKNIELKVHDNGRIVGLKNGNYMTHANVNEFIETLDVEDYKIRIINNEIILTDSKTKISIKIKTLSHIQNKTLLNIVEKSKKINLKNKRKFLREKKVKRIKAIGTVIVVSLAFIAGTFYSNHEDLFSLNPTIETVESYNGELSSMEQRKINVDFESRVDTEKFIVTKKWYGDFIANIANEYGIDPQIMIAIATQESGIHDTRDDRAAIGLMQIEKAVWDNEKLTAYNYSKKTYETLTINKERLKDLEFNIRVACMHFQHCLKASKYNLPVAIQMYNFGYGNMDKIFKLCYGQSATIENTSSKCDNEWLDYRSYLETGDENYLEHILSYIENSDIKCVTEMGTSTYSISPNVKSL